MGQEILNAASECGTPGSCVERSHKVVIYLTFPFVAHSFIGKAGLVFVHQQVRLTHIHTYIPINQPFVSCKNVLKSVIIHPGRSFIQSGFVY